MSFSEKKGDQEGKGPAGSKTVFSDPQAWTRLKVPEGYTEKKKTLQPLPSQLIS